MILIDSSVWIDFLEERQTLQTNFMHDQLGQINFAVGDLIITEVLQGYKHEKAYQNAKQALLSLPVYELGGVEMAIQAAHNYRSLRKKGVTLRGTIDVLIATFCIERGCKLLYCDRDFDAMVNHIGLMPAIRTIH